MKKNNTDYVAVGISLNQLRMRLNGEEISFAEINEKVKMPYARRMIEFLVKQHKLTVRKQGNCYMYKFTDNPIAQVLIKAGYEIIRKEVAKINKEYNINMSKKQDKSQPNINAEIQAAIKLLKDNGYHIQKPVMTYEDI